MNILIIGDEARRSELKQKMPDNVKVYEVAEDVSLAEPLTSHDVIFDLSADNTVQHLKKYVAEESIWVFASAVKKQLVQMIAEAGHPKVGCNLFGMNAWPTFLNKEVLELSSYNKDTDKNPLSELLGSLNWSYEMSEDRVGMVTPRVIAMIINEACYTLQEGTAGMRDIDAAMKLGTNYPYGPFEWADRIGIRYIYETLNAVYDDTGDERYKICSLLKTKYLRQEPFYINQG